MINSHRNPRDPNRFIRGLTSWLHSHWSGAENLQQTTGAVAPTVDAFSLNGGLNVLVVDDNPSYLGMASDFLERCGVSALLAGDGAEAVNLARRRRFDIILMDLQMPVMDGLEATACIRQLERIHHRIRTPVVAFTNSDMSEALLTASGIDDRMGKPCTAAELEACLLRWCDGFHAPRFSGHVQARPHHA